MIEKKFDKKEDPHVSGKPVVVHTPHEPTREDIAALAYDLWIERGSPHGSHEEDWHHAEAQLRKAQPLTKAAGA